MFRIASALKRIGVRWAPQNAMERSQYQNSRKLVAITAFVT